jgi:hypothetical protein
MRSALFWLSLFARSRPRALRTAVCALSCVLVVHSCREVASADPDYYQALESADTALIGRRFEDAMRVLQSALRKYPDDYALTLKLAWVQLQWGHYADAERTYQAASELSDGSLDARVGLGWALILQERCKAGIEVLNGVLSEDPDEDASRGIRLCAERERVHGTVWGSWGGSLYRRHPWLDAGEAGFLAFTLRPTRKFEIGAAYRVSRLIASDERIPGLTQHEAYVEAGFIGKHLDVLGQGALIWGGDAIVGGSRHVGSTLRIKSWSDYLSEVSVDVSGSFYRDLWVIGLATTATLTLGPLSLTGGVAAQQFEHARMISVSLTPSLVFGDVSFWIGGKYGPEYRAAYLSQFAVFNAADSSQWSVLSGVRIRTSEHWSVFLSYALLGLESPDGLASTLHSLAVGTAFAL